MTQNKNEQIIYRVQFKNEYIIYDLYVRHIYPSDMPGFTCLEGFLFHEETQLLIDPRTEKLQQEFANVTTAFVPYYQIIRIDQVTKKGESSAKEVAKTDHKLMPFPKN